MAASRETMHVTPAVLQWARETASMRPEEAAKKLQLKNKSTILEWEKGKGGPTYGQLKSLGRIYRRPIVIFFFSKPLNEPDIIKAQFRSLSPSQIKDIPSNIRLAIRDAEVKKANLEELLGKRRPSLKIFSDINAVGNGAESAMRLAASVRAHLNISLNDQKRWKNEKTALEKWQEALEKSGFWIFKDALQNDDYCGFCLHDKAFPIIYLNNSMPPTRKIFTLFHELGHLLKGMGGIDFRESADPKYKSEEVFCNAFAGEFLVPDDDINSYLAQSPASDNVFGDIAEEYKVSKEVILRKFLNKGVVSPKEYGGYVQKWKNEHKQARQSKQGGGGQYTRCAYLGAKYMSVVFDKYYQNVIDEYELIDYLGVRAQSSLLSRMEEYALKRWWDVS